MHGSKFGGRVTKQFFNLHTTLLKMAKVAFKFNYVHKFCCEKGTWNFFWMKILLGYPLLIAWHTVTHDNLLLKIVNTNTLSLESKL